ncbi:MAG: hypothetical protein HOE95_09975 [Flavobacteriales bacterium]|nr:hypothetical protein [Flavobacteriales bacterium]MBT4929803.1 hypothetical protein [Flavobacteriales bacterium]MBT5133272.1 hypothetical protein [Flavobacteriales bacterium]MBT5976604.1 hypothetical protein [Flavobacteriales bacterium]MBT6131843.1 hypothetical protein [Flavobacteriales bacterium]
MNVERLISCCSVLILLQLGACKKDDIADEVSVVIEIRHEVDGAELAMKGTTYINQAGNEFDVSKLQYYISGIEFVGNEFNAVFDEEAFYVDAEDNSTYGISLSLSPATYSKMKFSIGVIPDLNEHEAIPKTIENTNMMWPEPMGGGYHFLKLEGHYRNHEGESDGYALHVGNDENLIEVELENSIAINDESPIVILTMDVSQWFKNSNEYDLNDQNYSMGSGPLMRQISENGRNVFSISLENK